MMAMQEISDRLEIQQLLVDYASAIDAREFAQLADVFTVDAWIDYSALGGISGDAPTIIAWLPGALAAVPVYQHIVANIDIRLAGDTATGRAICLNPMAMSDTRVGFYGLWYVDSFVRTPAGWRIARRVEERAFAHNFAER